VKAEHVNAFIKATVETMQSMCSVTLLRDGEIRKASGEIVTTDELMAICGFSGSVRGALMMNAPLIVGQALVSKFMMEKITTINCDLMDGWGEISNIIVGNADAKIPEHRLNLALPSVLYGKDACFFAKAGNPFVIVPLRISGIGSFSIGVSMIEV